MPEGITGEVLKTDTPSGVSYHFILTDFQGKPLSFFWTPNDLGKQGIPNPDPKFIPIIQFFKENLM